jgi:hypothetical protein
MFLVLYGSAVLCSENGRLWDKRSPRPLQFAVETVALSPKSAIVEFV